MKTIIVSTCGHALRIRALLIVFRLLNCLLIVRYPQKHHRGTWDSHHASIRREAHAHARRQRISLAQIMAE
jgi:hypothetical protein